MFEVLIADDEQRILRGLKIIVDWKELGYVITGEASDGEEALEMLLRQKPSIALIDINMPKMSGLDVIRNAYEKGFQGKIIILSGYSEFKFAQEAIQLGVDFYLSKPIDEVELEVILGKLKRQLEEETRSKLTTSRYYERARETILRDLMINPSKIGAIDLFDMNLYPIKYMVVICEEYVHQYGDKTHLFGRLFPAEKNHTDIYESIFIGSAEVVLLKGITAVHVFQDRARQCFDPDRQTGDLHTQNMFLSCGRVVGSFSEIHISYQDAKDLSERRFFCKPHQHMVAYEDQGQPSRRAITPGADWLTGQTDSLCGCISSLNRTRLSEVLQSLEEYLCRSNLAISEIRFLLIDIYLKIKAEMSRAYNTAHIPFPDNSWVMDFIQNRKYLYEIIYFYAEQFEMVMGCIGNYSKDSVLDDVMNYVNHHYMKNLKLEEIALLFGYNASYLGKIFKKRTDMSFHHYLDKVRIDASKKLLLEPARKVYEVAEMVGYSTVNYFYIKFKKHTGESAQEYRKRHGPGR